MDDTDNDGAVATIDCAAGRLEDANGVVDNGIDPGKLLEEHNTRGNSKRFYNWTFQQFRELNHFLPAGIGRFLGIGLFSCSRLSTILLNSGSAFVFLNINYNSGVEI